jgi:hypothetical protein
MHEELALWIIAGASALCTVLIAIHTVIVERDRRRPIAVQPLALPAPAALAGDKPSKRAAVAKSMPRRNGKFASRAPS